MTTEPTIVLVHGAFAESASWNGVIRRLQEAGYTAIAAANPLRSLDGDASSVASIIESIDGPVVAVGHSYGGAVVSEAAHGLDNVKAFVFVAAFAPEEGESIAYLSGKYPGSTLGDTLAPVPLQDGSTDLYIRQDRYQQQFAADVPLAQSARQRCRTASAARRCAQRHGDVGVVAIRSVVVHLARTGQQHPAGRSPLHGRTGRRSGSRRGARGLPLPPGLAARCRRRHDHRGRQAHPVDGCRPRRRPRPTAVPAPNSVREPSRARSRHGNSTNK